MNTIVLDRPIETISTQHIPLVVDVDGTLVKTDMLCESFFDSVTKGFRHNLFALMALLKGKARLKAYLADSSRIDYALLPYDEEVLSLVRQKHDEGRRIYLATASDRRHAEGIAAHIGIIDGIFASDGNTNLSGHAKARRLIEAFGAGGFDYVGDSYVDLAIWSQTHKAITVGAKAGLRNKVENLNVQFDHLEGRTPTFGSWIRALRVQQYAKNILLFVPLLTAHAYSLSSFSQAVVAFVAFSLCASSVYLLNDLIDLDADRRHPTKQKRPLASGAIPIVQGIVAVPLLILFAFVCALSQSPMLAVVLAGYLVVSLAYSLSLKRKLLVDVVVLSMLYTTRVIAGAVAISVTPSEWLLAFAMFVFTCLALVKRYGELALRMDRDLPNPTNRNYQLTDLPIVGALAAASGLNAVTIFALYISSTTVRELYRHPEMLWLACPILLYWIGRMVILAHRRAINDDPLLFALRDRNSHIAAALMIAIVFLAS